MGTELEAFLEEHATFGPGGDVHRRIDKAVFSLPLMRVLHALDDLTASVQAVTPAGMEACVSVQTGPSGRRVNVDLFTERRAGRSLVASWGFPVGMTVGHPGDRGSCANG